jgi:CRP-like cAMP-binding protein
MTRKPDSAKGRMTAEEFRQLLTEDQDLLQVIVEQTVQQVLEAERTEALQASKSERTETRLGYRAGYYPRLLITVSASSSGGCRRTGQDVSGPRSSSAISAAKRPWWRPG